MLFLPSTLTVFVHAAFAQQRVLSFSLEPFQL